MELKLYNTLTAKKEVFKPLNDKNVRMYVCGPTVYDYAHIGNARPVIVFDVLFRLLRHVYGADHVTYARNITDVDDKINARAADEGVPISDVTTRTTKQFHDDIAALGVLPPSVEPRATDHIEPMKALIEQLVENGNAYVAEGHVLFHVPSMPDYGKLSKRSTDEMEAGARVEVAPYKKDPMDFVLWKPSKDGEPSWPSPCGIEIKGRPGWHIECSAMSAQHLGVEFDIHGGGIDLVFPHHENEIAQSRCGHGTDTMAQVWMHNGYLQVEGQKMSKSLGNFITIRELLQGWPGEAIRLAMLSTHYRQPFNWTEAGVREARRTLDRWAMLALNEASWIESELLSNNGIIDSPDPELIAALGDDLNTPLAISRLHEISEDASSDSIAAKNLLRSACWLGLLRPDKLWVFSNLTVSERVVGRDHPTIKFNQEIQEIRAAIANNDHLEVSSIYEPKIHEIEKDGWSVKIETDGYIHFDTTIRSDDEITLEARVEELIAARKAARAAKDFAEADRIRDELAEMGVALKDGPGGTTWEIAR